MTFRVHLAQNVDLPVHISANPEKIKNVLIKDDHFMIRLMMLTYLPFLFFFQKYRLEVFCSSTLSTNVNKAKGTLVPERGWKYYIIIAPKSLSPGFVPRVPRICPQGSQSSSPGLVPRARP